MLPLSAVNIIAKADHVLSSPRKSVGANVSTLRYVSYSAGTRIQSVRLLLESPVIGRRASKVRQELIHGGVQYHYRAYCNYLCRRKNAMLLPLSVCLSACLSVRKIT